MQGNMRFIIAAAAVLFCTVLSVALYQRFHSSIPPQALMGQATGCSYNPCNLQPDDGFCYASVNKPAQCYGGSFCASGQSCLNDPNSCSNYACCGNGSCDTPIETSGNCSADCGGGMSSSSSSSIRCGDGIINGTEQCDDGNTANSDGCSSACKKEECGDGLDNDGDGKADCGDPGCYNICSDPLPPIDQCDKSRTELNPCERGDGAGATAMLPSGSPIASLLADITSICDPNLTNTANGENPDCGSDPTKRCRAGCPYTDGNCYTFPQTSPPNVSPTFQCQSCAPTGGTCWSGRDCCDGSYWGSPEDGFNETCFVLEDQPGRPGGCMARTSVTPPQCVLAVGGPGGGFGPGGGVSGDTGGGTGGSTGSTGSNGSSPSLSSARSSVRPSSAPSSAASSTSSINPCVSSAGPAKPFAWRSILYRFFSAQISGSGCPPPSDVYQASVTCDENQMTCRRNANGDSYRIQLCTNAYASCINNLGNCPTNSCQSADAHNACLNGTPDLNACISGCGQNGTCSQKCMDEWVIYIARCGTVCGSSASRASTSPVSASSAAPCSSASTKSSQSSSKVSSTSSASSASSAAVSCSSQPEWKCVGTPPTVCNSQEEYDKVTRCEKECQADEYACRQKALEQESSLRYGDSNCPVYGPLWFCANDAFYCACDCQRKFVGLCSSASASNRSASSSSRSTSSQSSGSVQSSTSSTIIHCQSDADCPPPPVASCTICKTQPDGSCAMNCPNFQNKCVNNVCTLINQSTTTLCAANLCINSSSQTSSQGSSGSSRSSGNSQSSGGSQASLTCLTEGFQPQMRITYTRAESTNPQAIVEPRTYIDGNNPRMVNGKAETIESGVWVPISRVDVDLPVDLETQSYYYRGANLMRFRGEGSATIGQMLYRVDPYLTGPTGKPEDAPYDIRYGTIEFQGVSVIDAYCRKDTYRWDCPELERDGTVLAPDNDEVWVENGVVHFALHTKDVTNTEGSVDNFFILYNLAPNLPTCSSARFSTSSTSSTSFCIQYPWLCPSSSSARFSTSSTSSTSFCIQYPWLCPSSSSNFSQGSSNSQSACFNTECSLGGSLFCAAQNKTCVNILALPCIECVNTSSTSSTSSKASQSSTLSCISLCGNTQRECSEECDDGNLSNDDGCSNTCFLEGGSCGDNIIQSLRNEQCEPNLTDPSSLCNAQTCQLTQQYSSSGNTYRCGDGRRTGIEECDSTQNCDSSCRLISGQCGDGIVQRNNNEECEPAVQTSIACTNNCRYNFRHSSTPFTPVLFEDLSSASPESSASSPSFPSFLTKEEYQRLIALLPDSSPACVTDADCPYPARCILNRCLTPEDLTPLPPFCGNAHIDAGEGCDEGSMNSELPNAACRPDCTPSRCGDGVTDTPLEQCDDGNLTRNDGCSPTCQPERTAPSQTLPATTIELPFTTKDPGSEIGDPGSEIGDRDSAIPNQPNVPNAPSTPDTGPTAVLIMIGGAAAGYAWRRKK